MIYSRNLIEFLSMPELSMAGYRRSPGVMKYLVLEPIACAMFTAICLIVSVAVHLEQHFSVPGVRQSSVWDGLLRPIFIHIIIFCRDGSYWCAIWFVTFFGKQVIEQFELLCVEIINHSEIGAAAITSVPVDIEVLAIPETSGRDKQVCADGEELKDRFVELKTAFGTYSIIGGAFSFAAVMDVGAWAFSSMCAVLFDNGNSGSTFDYVIQIFETMMAVLTLLTITEVGHQIGSKVNIYLLGKAI